MSEKKLLAINNETGERIEFGIEDIGSTDTSLGVSILLTQTKKHYLVLQEQMLKDGLKDHTLYYLHEGIYYNYETQEEMV